MQQKIEGYLNERGEITSYTVSFASFRQCEWKYENEEEFD